MIISTANPDWPASPFASLGRTLPVSTAAQRETARAAMREWGINSTPVWRLTRGGRRPAGATLRAE